MFDWKVSLDTLLIAGSFLIFITLYVTQMKQTAAVFDVRLGTIDKAMADFREELKKLQEVIVNQKLQDQRINNMDERLILTGKRLDKLTEKVDAKG